MSKYPIDPKCLAQVRNEAAKAAKINHNNKLFALAALADDILQSYGTATELKELQRKNYKMRIN
jgi:hypothetical protein